MFVRYFGELGSLFTASSYNLRAWGNFPIFETIVTLFIQCICSLIFFLSYLRVDVLFGIFLLLQLFRSIKIVFHLLVVILDQTFLVPGYRLIKFSLLLQNWSFSCVHFGFLNPVLDDSVFEKFFGFLHFLKCFLELSHLDVNCCFVIIINYLFTVNTDSLIVMSECLFKFFIFESLISFLFGYFIRLLLDLHFFRLLLFFLRLCLFFILRLLCLLFWA